jgi:hypothetical protein
MTSHQDNDSNFLMVTGGLGNQLFQLSAGLYLTNNRNLTILSKLGFPRTDEFGLPDIGKYLLPDNVSIDCSKKRNRLVSKFSSFYLRNGAEKVQKSLKIRIILSITKVLLGIHVGRKVTFIQGKGVGFTDIVSESRENILIGYFQSYRYFANEDVKKPMLAMTLKSPSLILDQYRKFAEIEIPLVVHVRLGDYRFEPKIGIPNKNYYETAIRKMISEGTFKRIWLFSDEPGEARNYVPSDLLEITRLIPTDIGSPADTLELMRLGAGYVISNSSFSWWGANLSHSLNPSVICPTPWFKGMDEPIDIVPESWTRVRAWESD